MYIPSCKKNNSNSEHLGPVPEIHKIFRPYVSIVASLPSPYKLCCCLFSTPLCISKTIKWPKTLKFEVWNCKTKKTKIMEPNTIYSDIVNCVDSGNGKPTSL